MTPNRSHTRACLLAAGLAAATAIALGRGLLDARASATADVPPLAPLGLPPVPIPADNPLTPAKIALGEMLFFERALSVDGTVNCASCHKPDRFFADETPFSAGVGAQLGARNAVTVLNAAYASHLLWDGRSLSLEDQVRYPVTHPREMNNTQEKAVKALAANPVYPALFKEAFGDETIAWDRVTKALASFERTLVAGNAPFDRYVAGDRAAMSEAAVRGFARFTGPAGCTTCHAYSKESPFFSDFEFHNTGVGWTQSPDLGRYEVSKAREDKGAFRTPSLRNVAKTAPYMHDGSLTTLSAVIDYYVRGGDKNPFLDEHIAPVALSGTDKADLIAFLESLTGEVTYRAPRRQP
jgi:cytochrome c peroxidase